VILLVSGPEVHLFVDYTRNCADGSVIQPSPESLDVAQDGRRWASR
jgi:hypothetical protein